MKRDLKEELRETLTGRTALVGIGNVDLGDDALGVRLAERLQRAGLSSAVVAGTVPENIAGALARGGYDHVVFLDAVDFGAAPGSVVLMDATEIQSRFPQVSTHKISLGMTARVIESECRDTGLAVGSSAGLVADRIGNVRAGEADPEVAGRPADGSALR